MAFQVAEYIRISREDGDKAESDSIGNQRMLLNEFINTREDLRLYDTYIDDGFSGTNFNRPAFGRMLDDIEAGKVNCVIVKDLSRFGRDYIDTGRYLERYFPQRDIRFISVTDNIDSEKQAYDMLLPIKNIFNEQYARDISKKIHASMAAKQKAGEFIGAFASYGYKKSESDKNKLVTDHYAASVIQRIFTLYVNGYGKNSIAGILNREGILCPSLYKKMNGEQYKNGNRLEGTSYWTYSTINRILQNEMYLGNMVQGKKSQNMRSRPQIKGRREWIVVENTHEPIITQELWDKTQELLKRRTRSLPIAQDWSIFAGFLKCGDCGRALVKKVRKREGKEEVCYCCGTYVRMGKRYCTPHSIFCRDLENVITRDLNTMLQNVSDLSELVIKQIIEEKRVSAGNVYGKNREIQLKAELEKLGRMKKNAYEDYRDELISKEEFLSYRQSYKKKEELVLKQLQWAEDIGEGENIEDILQSPWFEELLKHKAIKKLDRNIAAEMIEEIKVWENCKILITYQVCAERKPQWAAGAWRQ